MSAFNMSMFESIKGALASNDSQKSRFSEILRCKPGNTYTVRLLPDSKSPADTFFHYFNTGWNSFATGQYVQTLSPQTFGDRCPISEERFKASRTGSEAEKEKAQAIRRQEKWLVNIYVIDDPVNPDNNGKVKLLSYGKQLHKIVTDAIEGDDAAEFGAKIFDLGDEGANFKIKCEQQGDYPTYVSSRFTTAGKIDLTEDRQKEVYDNTHELKTVFPLKSTDELKQMLSEHYFCGDDKGPEPVVTEQAPPWSAPAAAAPAPVAAPVVTAPAKSVEDDIDDLLADL